MKLRNTLLAIGVCLTTLLTYVGLQSVSSAATIGPDPTAAALEASRGPLTIANIVVPRQSNFGGGTIYYPTDGSRTYGGVAVVPGFVSPQSSIQWYGPRIASWGFVVITIDTLSPFDFPGSRADQLQAALQYILNDNTVKGRIDPTRLAAMGWSMGGGGTIQMPSRNPNLKALIPMAPWDLINNAGSDRLPTLFLTCGSDSIAPNGSFSDPEYAAIPAGVPKADLQLQGGDHFCVTHENQQLGKWAVSWLKRYVDGDTRFASFLCPATAPSGFTYKSTCPL